MLSLQKYKSLIKEPTDKGGVILCRRLFGLLFFRKKSNKKGSANKTIYPHRFQNDTITTILYFLDVTLKV